MLCRIIRGDDVRLMWCGALMLCRIKRWWRQAHVVYCSDAMSHQEVMTSGSCGVVFWCYVAPRRDDVWFIRIFELSFSAANHCLLIRIVTPHLNTIGISPRCEWTFNDWYKLQVEKWMSMNESVTEFLRFFLPTFLSPMADFLSPPLGL